MKSPFPGMDPYLERHGRDVHSRLVISVSDALQARLPGDLFARVEERICVESEEASRFVAPDVRVVEHGRGGAGVAVAEATETEEAESYFLDLPAEPLTETFLEIRDASEGGKVVTVLEILSPTNKAPGPGLDQYRRKQKELEKACVSLVEIDLLRQGAWALSVPRMHLMPRRRTTYCAIVRRGWKWRQAQIFPIALRKPVPPILVPLRETDEDLTLELQPLLDQCYRNGRYWTLNYQTPLDPPLQGAHAAWAQELLRTAGKLS